jgi:hypothetical protein
MDSSVFNAKVRRKRTWPALLGAIIVALFGDGIQIGGANNYLIARGLFSAAGVLVVIWLFGVLKYKPKRVLFTLLLLLPVGLGELLAWRYLAPIPDPSTSPATLGGIEGLFRKYITKSPPSLDLTNEILPGFASAGVLRIIDVAAARRKFIYEWETSENSSVAFYLSASDNFTFVATDIHNEPYQLEVQLGPEAMPIGRFVYFSCEVGTASRNSFLAVFVNGGRIGFRELPFHIDLGSRGWKSYGINANRYGSQSGAFDLSELGAWAVTFNPKQRMALFANADAFYGITKQ